MKTSDVKKELRSLGIKTYKNKNDKFFVRKGDIKKVLASIVKSNADDEERKLEGSWKPFCIGAAHLLFNPITYPVF